MKFGVFLPNGSNGYIPSAGSPVYLPTFEHNKVISIEAEKPGLDFVLSMMKFRGFGGETGYWDSCINERAAKAGREVVIYALFHVITVDTDEQAAAIGQDVIDKVDNGALRNILASVDLDTNTDGTADQLKAGLTQSLDDGNVAFMGVPAFHRSFATVARKIDQIEADTGIDGMPFSWPDFVTGWGDFGEPVKPLLGAGA